MAPHNSVLALIPARGGSKGIPRKNLRELAAYPLIAYTIAAARLSRRVSRVLVSTDSEEIAEVARSFGAEVPFLRPAEMAQDRSSDIDYVRHAADWLERNEGSCPPLILQLRPTTPLRDPEFMDESVSRIENVPLATSLRSVHQLPEPPQKMMGIRDGFLVGLFPDDPRPEYYNLPRQVFPPAYHPNGYVDIVRGDRVKNSEELYGPRVLGFVTPPAVEIDGPAEFEYLQFVLERKGHPLLEYLRKL